MTHSPDQLSLESARKKLGLGPADHAADYLPQWREVEKILVGKANREQDEAQLAIYEKDLAALRQVMDTLEKEPPKRKFSIGLLVWGGFVAALTVGGFWSWQEWGSKFDPIKAHAGLQARIEKVEQVIDKRRWDEATTLVEELRAAGASKQWARDTLARIAEERRVESGQEVGYFIGGTQAALEAGRLDEARAFLSKAREISPNNEKVIALIKQIDESEREFKLSQLVSGIESAIQNQKWVSAEGQLSDLVEFAPNHASLSELRHLLKNAQAKALADQERALALLTQAGELDQGSYSSEALRLLEQAMRLDPNDQVKAAYKRMSAYGRVMSVPDEFATIMAALKEARVRDRIQIAAGTYREKLHVPPGVVIVGESKATTIIECQAADGAVLTLDQTGAIARAASLTLRHQGLVNDDERFSVVTVSEGKLRLEDVKIDRASGHGVAVLDGGAVEMIQSKVTRSGWDGISVQGEGSMAKLTSVVSRENLHHGIDFWDGASGLVSDSTLVKNGRAGIVALAPLSAVTVNSCLVSENRELGILISGAPAATIMNSRINKNALGGVVLQDQVIQAEISNNQITDNQEVGLVIERGSQASLNNNTVQGNSGRQLWQDAVFPTVPKIEVTTPPVPAPPE